MAVVLARAAASLGAERRAPSGRARRTAARRARAAAAQQDAVQGAPYEPQEPGRTPGCAGNNFDPVSLSTGLSPEVEARCSALVNSANIVLFMKGERHAPKCGFSNTSVQVLDACGAAYKTVDILSEPGARDAMKAFSMWPTFPQLYVEGEFFGGCDIICDMYKCGELQELVERINLE